MSPKISFKVCVSAFAVWVVINTVLLATGQVTSPWNESQPYMAVGWVMASVTFLSGCHAWSAGKETLKPEARKFAGWMVLAAVSFVICVITA